MTEFQRKIISLNESKQLSEQQIADQLNVDVARVKQVLKREERRRRLNNNGSSNS